MNTAICVIGYNRLSSIRRLLNSLNNAVYDKEVTLIISIDKSDIDDVENYADSFIWNYGKKRVVKHKNNLGLRNHILKCGTFLDEFDALIVLEDDIEVSPGYFIYAEQCIDRFYNDSEIAGISLYSFCVNYQNNLPFVPLHSESDIYLMKCAQSWGQVWMKNQWKEFYKWYINNDQEFPVLPHLPVNVCKWPKSSWLKYHTRYCIENNKYFVYPYISLTTNYSDVGVHSNKTSFLFQTPMLYGCKHDYNLTPTIRYDGFFENENLYKVLNIDKETLCVDLYDEKRNRENKRFILTTRRLNYKILSSYGLQLRPIELNIIKKVPGNDIYLYDTNCTVANSFLNNDKNKYTYLYNLNNYILEIIKPNIPLRQYIKNKIKVTLKLK